MLILPRTIDAKTVTELGKNGNRLQWKRTKQLRMGLYHEGERHSSQHAGWSSNQMCLGFRAFGGRFEREC